MVGSSVSSPMRTSTSLEASRAWATRPPQKVARPVMSTRLPISGLLPAVPGRVGGPSSSEPHRSPVAQHLVERFLDPLPHVLGLVHDAAARIALLTGGHVEPDGIQHLELE